MLMHTGFTLWFTGMSGSGKSTVSRLLEKRLRALGAKVEVLDGDVVRTNLCRGLGFTKQDREENVRRIGFLCELLSRNGVITIVAAISPYRACREELKARIPRFIEIYMCCPMDLLVERDVKGLYKKALAGEIPQFTGVSDPYEPPLKPDMIVDSSQEEPEQSMLRILDRILKLGYLSFDEGLLSADALQPGVDIV